MSGDAAPVFPVTAERRFPLVLVWFILVSLLAHTATFFLFQIVYPQHLTLPPVSPQVTLLMPDSPEREALLRWVAAEDPSLVAASAGAEPLGLLQLEYHPSYAALRTPPRSVPDPAERQEPPPSPLSIHPGSLAAAPEASSPRSPVATTVLLSGSLRARKLVSTDLPTVHATAPLQPAQFLLALTPRGEAQFAFLQHSSGDEQADAAAARWLAGAVFSAGEPALVWGLATVRWGDDTYIPAGP